MTMQMPTPSSKRFEALVTDLTDSYRHNPYVQTTVHIVLLQMVLTVLTVAVFGFGIQYSQTQTVSSISQHITNAAHGAPDLENLAQSIVSVRSKTIWYVFLSLMVLTILFGFLAARFALRPTRNSLQFQKRFIGNVAHEIRTPLAIIKTSTEVTLMDSTVPSDIRSTLMQTVHELDRISETINNLLSFDTLIRPGRIKSEPVDLKSVVHTVVQRHLSLAHSRGIMLSVQAPGNEYRIRGNAVALDQVITNLVKNALNYTPQKKGGSVTVKLDTDYRGRILLGISDTGIGIANEIVRLHRGTITVRSALGRGTTIELSFPRFMQLEQRRSPFATQTDD